MIQEFLKDFSDVHIENLERAGKQFYQQTPIIKKEVDSLDEYPTSAGLFLGEIIKGRFIPSPNLLEIMYVQTGKTIIINDNTAWLFICGRDIFIEGVVERCFEKGAVLVLNEKREILGIAKKDGKEYKNIYDIGYLLRREQSKKGKR